MDSEQLIKKHLEIVTLLCQMQSTEKVAKDAGLGEEGIESLQRKYAKRYCEVLEQVTLSTLEYMGATPLN